jgi:hypothetical protein
MEKVVRDGKVAIVLSAGYGAGWGSWNYGVHDVIMFHPKIIQMVEEGREMDITEEWLEKELGLEGVYTGGREGLYIEWVPEGTKFRIDEYDGAETIITDEDLDMVA